MRISIRNFTSFGAKMSKLILPDGNYHICSHPERCYIVPRNYDVAIQKEDGILYEKDLVASVRGELKLINRSNGSILLRSIHNGNYLTIEPNDRNSIAFSYEARESESVRKWAEFELHSPPFNTDANLKGACSIYSSEVQSYLNDALTAKETDHSKAAVFILEPSTQFMASVQQRLPPGVYRIRIRYRWYGSDFYYLVANNEGMLQAPTSNNSAPPGQFRLEYVNGSGAIRLATLDGKYLCPDIETNDRDVYPNEYHKALKFKPINKDESTIPTAKKYEEISVEFEISTWKSDRVVTLREARCDNKFMNVHSFFFDFHRHLPDISNLVCLTNYEEYENPESESSILERAHGLKFEPVP